MSKEQKHTLNSAKGKSFLYQLMEQRRFAQIGAEQALHQSKILPVIKII
jgi:hypothetical protein